MSTKHTRREYQTRSSVNTRAQSKSISYSTEIDDHSLISNEVSKDQKKRKRHNLFVDTERVQKNIVNEDDNMNNAKRMKQLDGLHFPKRTSRVSDFSEVVHSPSVYRNRNKTPEKVQLPTKRTIEVGTTLYSPNLINSSIVRSHTLPRSTNASQKLSRPASFPRSKISKQLALTSKFSIKTQKNDVSFKNNSPQVKSRLSNGTANTRQTISSKHDTPTHSKIPSVMKNKSKNVTSSSIKQGSRKFFKSPKIVLKNFSKSKSISKKKNKKKSSSSKAESPNTECNYTTSRISKAEFLCNENSDSRTDTANYATNDSTNVASSTRLSCTKNAFALKEPVVVLQRLSITVPISTPSLPLSSSFIETRINSISNRSLETSKFSSYKSHLKATDSNKLQRTDKTAKVNNASETSLEPLMSSTPRNGNQFGKRNDKRETIETSGVHDATFELSKCDVNIQRETSKEIENEQEEVREKDETYELIEPKTPNLRKKLDELKDKVNSKEKTTKIGLRVRFTSRLSNTNCTHGFRLCTICDKKEQIECFDNATITAKLKNNGSKSPGYTFRKRLNSPSNRTNSTPSFQFGRRLKSVTNTGIASTSPLTTPVKKPYPKYSAAKKVPNFAEIHKKIFAKSVSIVDAKRRLEEKHLTLTTSMNKSAITWKKENSKKESQVPSESSNGLYNRFGFKIRKNDATNCILKKSNVQSIRSKQQQQQQQTRAILKGVRTNRRFELQMKARNINV